VEDSDEVVSFSNFTPDKLFDITSMLEIGESVDGILRGNVVLLDEVPSEELLIDTEYVRNSIV
jgi:hypothetical protein